MTIFGDTSSAVIDELIRIFQSGGERSAREVASMAASHLLDRVDSMSRGLSGSGVLRIASTALELLALRCGVEPRPLFGVDPIDPRSGFWSSLAPGEVEALGDELMVSSAPYVAALRVIHREVDVLDLESVRYLESAVGSADQGNSSLARKLLIATCVASADRGQSGVVG